LIESLDLAPIERTSVADEIVKRLVQHILEGRLKPGDKLPSERELMERLSVGKSSLREGIKTLRALGVIEVAVGEGMFVGRGETSILSRPLSWGLLLSERSTQEVIEARSCVEAKLASLAAERATDDEIAALGDKLAVMRATIDDPGEYSRSDLEFHLAIAEAAHNQLLSQVLQSLQHILRIWIVEVIVRMDDLTVSLADHVAIYEAIRARDPEAARQTVDGAMERGGARLLAAMALSSAHSSSGGQEESGGEQSVAPERSAG
jgi:GntR family transcriptional regulator, transcriptional repressor for pyruvate dehydrogenase complex